MISSVFNQVFFLPLYNALVWLSGILPGGDVGLAIVVLTLLVKVLLFPLQHRMTKTQAALKRLEPQLAALKSEYADNKSEQAKRIMALYQEHGVNPFSGFVILLIQLPILIALFLVFKDSFLLRPEWLYSFVASPTVSSTNFLGWLDITTRSIWFAVLVGVSQFIQMRLVMPPPAPKPVEQKPSLAADFQRSLGWQMRYFMPVMVAFIAAGLPAALSLYWLTSNLFAIGHELLINRRLKRTQA